MGAGAQNLQEVKAHPFFQGVQWEGLLNSPAPAFARPQHAPEVESVGLDWEMSSLAAALPVAYQAHEGAPMHYTSGVCGPAQVPAGTMPGASGPCHCLVNVTNMRH